MVPIACKHASNDYSFRMCPTRPPHGGTCESIHSRKRRIFTNCPSLTLVLSRNSAEKSRGRGYYIPTPPSYCFIPLSCTRFVKELRRKISRAQPAKIFAPLTTMKNSIINTRAERFPAPRLNCKTAPLSSQSPPRLLVCTCSHLIYPLADGSLLPTLDKGANIPLLPAFRLRGYEEFWGLQRGQLGKCPLCRFRFLLRSKGRISCLSARKTKLRLCFFQSLRKKTRPLSLKIRRRRARAKN